MKFYLGTHEPSWLASAHVPLFVSRVRLAKRRAFPRATTAWALDSGGFSELSLHGDWRTTPMTYVAEVARFVREVGMLEWAAPQDWMCEPEMVKKTGLTVREHQRRTVFNYVELRELAPDLPFVPVLQGWTMGDYEDCIELYARTGVDLAELPRVGIGSVCRRQNTLRAALLVKDLARQGLKLHGFGFKATGLRAAGDALASSDSMAWSLHARREPPLETCTHARCSSCLPFALEWRRELLDSLACARDAV
jgi:hypothetical protein